MEIIGFVPEIRQYFQTGYLIGIYLVNHKKVSLFNQAQNAQQGRDSQNETFLDCQ